MEQTKIALLKISSFKVSSKAELAAVLVDFLCRLKGIKLSRTEVYVLSHFMCEGYNQVTKEQIISGGLLKNSQSLSNTLTTLRKQGVIIKDGYKEAIAPDFRIPITDKVKIDIMLDNT